MHRLFLGLGFTLGFLAVALGAFGAHALGDRLSPSERVIFDTAFRYHALHAVAIVLVGLAAARWPRRGWAVPAVLFAAGTFVFAGSLYGLAVSGVGALGAITPIGGLMLLGGWLWAAWIGLTRT